MSEMVVPGGGPEERCVLCIQKGQQRASVAGRKTEGRRHKRMTEPGRLSKASERFTFSSEAGGKAMEVFSADDFHGLTSMAQGPLWQPLWGVGASGPQQRDGGFCCHPGWPYCWRKGHERRAVSKLTVKTYTTNVLVCLSANNRMPQTRRLINNRHPFSNVLEAGSSRSGWHQRWVRAHFSVYRWSFSCHALT